MGNVSFPYKDDPLDRYLLMPKRSVTWRHFSTTNPSSSQLHEAPNLIPNSFTIPLVHDPKRHLQNLNTHENGHELNHLHRLSLAKLVTTTDLWIASKDLHLEPASFLRIERQWSWNDYFLDPCTQTLPLEHCSISQHFCHNLWFLWATPRIKIIVTPGFRRQTECEPCTCQDQKLTYPALT
jgi:hypothetical protein